MNRGNQENSRDAVFYRQVVFSLSPAEFLAFVWVYRNEIQPVFDKQRGVSPSTPNDMRVYYSEIRNGILNGDLRKCHLKPGEIIFFEKQSGELFAPFRSSTDRTRKPDTPLIEYARRTMTDLIVECGKGKLINLESSLMDGKISFTIGPAVETSLKRPCQ